MGDEVKRLRPGQQTLQEVNVEAENINLNTDEIEGQQVDGTQQTRITDGTTIAGVAAATAGLQADLVGLAGADVDAGGGDKSPQTQRVTLADDDLNAAILASMVATFGVAAVANGLQLAAIGKDNVPTAVAEGQAVRLLGNRIGELFLAAHNRAQRSIDTSPVSAAKIPPLIDPVMGGPLTASPTYTPWRDVQMYSNPTLEYVISAIGTDVDLIIQGVIATDQSNPFTLWDDKILAADPQTLAVFWHGLQVTHIRGGLVGINGGTPSVSWLLTSGNSG